jgi:hypothetical protein
MERLKITVHPLSSDGELLRVDDAMQQVIDYLKLLQEAEHAMASPDESFDWRLESASTNSPFTIVAVAEAYNPTINVDAHARNVKSEFASGMRRLIKDRELPYWMSPEGLVIAKSIFARTQTGIGNTEIEIATGEKLAIDRQEAEAGIRAIAGVSAISVDGTDVGERVAYGEIEGQMVAAGRNWNAPAIQIRSEQYGFVWCRLAKELIERFGGEHKMSEIWEGKTVGVEGRLIYAVGGKLSRIEAKSIREITSALPIDLDSVLDPNFTSGLDPVEYLNKLHEGDLA